MKIEEGRGRLKIENKGGGRIRGEEMMIRGRYEGEKSGRELVLKKRAWINLFSASLLDLELSLHSHPPPHSPGHLRPPLTKYRKNLKKKE